MRPPSNLREQPVGSAGNVKCPLCQHADTKVADSRLKNDRRRRTRECTQCGNRFITTEVLGDVQGGLPLLRHKVVKKNGKLVDFDRDKLRQSISVAVRKSRRDDVPIDDIVDNIEQEISTSLNETTKTTEIGKHVLAALLQYDRLAYIRYWSVHHSLESSAEIEQMIGELQKLRDAPPGDEQ